MRAGESKVIDVKISRNGRRRVMREKKAKCRISAVTRSGGRTTTARKTVTVKAPRGQSRDELTGTRRLVDPRCAARVAARAGWATPPRRRGTVCGTGADRFFEIYVYNALIFVAGGLCLARAVVNRPGAGRVARAGARAARVGRG